MFTVQELVLRDNKLRKIPDVSIFKNLLVFDVSFNEISSLNGLSNVSNTLKELYVSKNEVNKMEELEHLHSLQILELGSNRLRVSIIYQLEDLWLNDNQIPSLKGIDVAVSGSREKLTTIYLERNPCATSSEYSTTLRQIFPNLQQIDSDIFM
ncbi:hypothetical protein BHE74_00058749 [Ensete ventricosum]|uniref:Uncharacterized protein n=1 Tax=Ensete ventricosum TaxID=4639 RepID=A0A444E3Q0_ENSVE|nr:hypothetical protein B296_00053021 [Ensete ventricosum]RWW05002.1 hypothetical protein GW17_00031749 [Ensete ventricosum]RWW36257.1 hypothetical protein BHE74_00058749 [Ensete ventricosum]RZR92115.1 hypothetical protein BHM03_00020367 [Ensete ventricosum]